VAAENFSWAKRFAKFNKSGSEKVSTDIETII
jgi:hypothetical protein